MAQFNEKEIEEDIAGKVVLSEEKFHVPVSKVEDFGIVTPKTSDLINISDKAITVELKRKKSKEARAEMGACQEVAHKAKLEQVNT